MRKKILAMLPVGLVALSLTGCGNNPNAQLATQVEELSDRFALARSTGFGLTGPRTYTVAHTVESVELPADMSRQAVELDELLALRPEIETAYSDPAALPGQKAVLARMLAEIDLAHAYYLGHVAGDSYDYAKTGATALQPYANKVDLMLGVIAMRQGDRATIIDTLETGNAGNDTQIEGVQQLEARVRQIQGRIDAALDKVREHESAAEDANRDVSSHDELQLELAIEARPLTGDEQFNVLNRSVEAWLQARLAEITAESNTLLAGAHAQTAEKNEHDLQMVQRVIGQLEESIAEVRAEMDRLRGAVNDAKREKDTALTDLDSEFRAVDGQMQQLVFARLREAIAKAQSAADLYGGITATGGAKEAMEREQLTAMLVQLQLYHQYAIETSGYKSAIDALLANGDVVLGRTLTGDLETLSADLASQLDAIKAEAAPVQEAASDLAGILVNRAGAETQAATLLAEQSERIDAVRTGLADLPY